MNGGDCGVSMRVRHTVMDGEIRMFAVTFTDVMQKTRGMRYDPVGPFYVSASRSQVVVHRCTLRTVSDCEMFQAAVALAMASMLDLRRKVT